MTWLKKRIRNWLADYNNEKTRMNSSEPVREIEGLDSRPIRLSIYYASGGIVVETRVYDKVKDKSYNQLHIINREDDIGHSLSKIITMESLRN